MADDIFLAAIEWEPLSGGDTVRAFALPKGNVVGDAFRSLRVFRDLDWQVKGVASGQAAEGSLVVPVTKLRLGEGRSVRSISVTLKVPRATLARTLQAERRAPP